MASLNKVQLIGNAGRDAEVRYLPSGAAVANVSIATSMKRKDKQTGEVIEDTQWHRLTFFERLAEIAGEYVRKGTKIYVEGSLKYGTYTDKDGVEKHTTDIVVNSLQLLGGREQGGGQDSEPRQQPQRQQSNRQQAPQQRSQGNAPRGQQQRGNGSGFDDMDDDIPF